MSRIAIHPEQCGGRPCIRGMRIRVNLADIRLTRGRLFGMTKSEGQNPKEGAAVLECPWELPAAAEKLVNACGYHRHDEELADAKRAILGA